MDKYEYKIRSEEIKTLIGRKKYIEAMEIADTIDWRKVKNINMLCTVSDLYKLNRRFEESREILLLAYERYPGGRMIIYSLCELSIKLDDVVHAVEYYKEFVQNAPRDNGRYILQYKLYEAQDVTLEERIAVLEELKRREYREKWAYELAYLYHRVGLGTKCVEECDELILWFGEGRYVIKAMELKMLHTPLTPDQQKKYNKAKGIKATVPGKKEPKPVSVQDDELDIQVKPLNVGEYATINLQKELAESMKEVLGEEEVEQDIQPTMEYAAIDRFISSDHTTKNRPAPVNYTTEEIRDFQTELENNELEIYEEDYQTDEFDVPEIDESQEAVYTPQSQVQTYASAQPQVYAPDSFQVYQSLQPVKQPDFSLEGPGEFTREILSNLLEDTMNADGGVDTEEYAAPAAEEEVFFEDPDTAEIHLPIPEEEVQPRVVKMSRTAEIPRIIQSGQEEHRVRRGNKINSMPEPPVSSDFDVSYDTEDDQDATGDIPVTNIRDRKKKSRKRTGDTRKRNTDISDPDETNIYITDSDDTNIYIADSDDADNNISDTGSTDINMSYLNDADTGVPDSENTYTDVPDVKKANIAVTETGLADRENAGPIIQKTDEPEAAVPVSGRQVQKNDRYRYENLLAQESDGQIRLAVLPEDSLAQQITGQMSFIDILQEWERVKKENEEKRAEAFRQHVKEQTGEIFSQFDASTKEGILAELDTLAEESERKEKSSAKKSLVSETEPEENLPEVEELEEIEELSTTEQFTEETRQAVSLAAEDLSYGKPEEEPDTRKDEIEQQTDIEEEEDTEREEQGEKEPEEDKDRPEKETEESDERKTVREDKERSVKNDRPERSQRPMSAEEKKLFGPFIQTKSTKDQILETLDNISLASYTGNVILTGEAGMGSVKLAKNIIKEIQMSDSNFSGKMAKITGQALNNKDMEKTFSRLSNGALIVEGAGELKGNAVKSMVKLLEKEEQGIIVILEDTKINMNKLLDNYKVLHQNFNLRIDIEAMDNDTLVQFAKKYALEKEYSIDELGVLALYTRISELQTSEHSVTTKEVREIVDNAIHHANRKNISHFMDILLGKRYDDEDMIILREKDFV